MRSDAAVNRERLLRAAEDVFAQRGPAATLEDVAQAAAVSPATLYRHFTNKDTLVQEVLAQFFGHLIEKAEQAEQLSDAEGLRAFLHTVGLELAQKGGLSAPIWGDLAPAKLVTELRYRSVTLLKRAQQAGTVRSEVSPDDITATVWALRGIIHAQAIGSAHRGKALWRRHLETVLRGFAPHP